MDQALREKLSRIARSPELFLRDFAPLRNAAMLSPMSEETYRASAFLDNRLVRAGERDIGLKLDVLQRVVASQQPPERPIHWIFHVGHCGSTLISRMLGETPGLFALREPAVLMGLMRSARRLDEPGFPIRRPHWAQLKSLALTLLGRTWRDEQTALVKATSDVVDLAPALLAATGRERAILLYVDLETFLATMLRDHTRQELALFAQEFRIRDFRRLVPEAPAAVTDYTDGRLAALTWLLHVHSMAKVLDDPGTGDRAVALSFDGYLSAPAAALSALADFLGEPLSVDEAAELTAGAAGRYAKDPGRAYDRDRRARELDAARDAHRAEIEDAQAWAGEVAHRTPALDGLIERFRGPSPTPARP